MTQYILLLKLNLFIRKTKFPSTEVTEKEEKQLLTIFKKYNKKLNLLAVLPAADIEDWLQENASVKQKPTTIYSILLSTIKLPSSLGTRGYLGRMSLLPLVVTI